MFNSTCEHSLGFGRHEISQIIMSYLVENVDFIAVHAGLLPFAQNTLKWY
jgi:hypothetical protein